MPNCVDMDERQHSINFGRRHFLVHVAKSYSEKDCIEWRTLWFTEGRVNCYLMNEFHYSTSL